MAERVFGSHSDCRALTIAELPDIVCETGMGGPTLYFNPDGHWNRVAEIRGWGWMQYHLNGEALQDDFARELTRRWNACRPKEAEAKRLRAGLVLLLDAVSDLDDEARASFPEAAVTAAVTALATE